MLKFIIQKKKKSHLNEKLQYVNLPRSEDVRKRELTALLPTLDTPSINVK